MKEALLTGKRSTLGSEQTYTWLIHDLAKVSMFHLILGDSGSIPGRFRARVFFSTIMDRNVRRCLEAGGEGGGEE